MSRCSILLSVVPSLKKSCIERWQLLSKNLTYKSSDRGGGREGEREGGGRGEKLTPREHRAGVNSSINRVFPTRCTAMLI